MRKTDNFVRKMQVNGFYRDVELDESMGDEGDVRTKYSELTGVTEISNSGLRTILEIHTELDLEGFEDAETMENLRNSTSIRHHNRPAVQYRPWYTTQLR